MIRALLSGVAPKAARLKPSAESWSILEVVCHLDDEEREDFREHLDFILSTSLKAGLHRQHEEWHRIDSDRWVTGSTAKSARKRFSPVGSRITISTSANWWNSGA